MFVSALKTKRQRMQAEHIDEQPIWLQDRHAVKASISNAVVAPGSESMPKF